MIQRLVKYNLHPQEILKLQEGGELEVANHH